MASKLREWLWRYVPAEVVSLPLTVLCAIAVKTSTGSAAEAAHAATWGGNIGYFGTILLSDILRLRRGLRLQGRHYGWKALGRNVRALVAEFGAAEILDSFVVRPLLMFYLPKVTGYFTGGIIAAKFLADITFYLPAIIFYEWSKKQRWRDL